MQNLNDLKPVILDLLDGDKIELLFCSNALAGETGELCNYVKKLYRPVNKAMLKTLTKNQLLDNISKELPDIIFYVVLIAIILDIDLDKAFWDKMEYNAKKYGVTFEKRQ